MFFRALPLLALLAASACVSSVPTASLRAPGVGEAHTQVRANGTDLIDVLLIFPAGDDGQPTPGPHPAVVFLQGGFVAPERYGWQAEALARAGLVVAVPRHPLDLAFFSIENGEATRRHLVKPPAGTLLDGLVDPSRIAVGGHSLGAVVSMKLLLEGRFQAGVIEAGFGDPADAARLPSLKTPTLFLAAARDCQAKLADVAAGWAQLPGPSALVVLPGVTHFQFTGSDAPDVERGCPPVAGLADAHARIEQTVVAFLGAAFSDGSVGETALRAVPGVEVQVR